jgi:glucose/arabinose dehydrogenase
MRVARSLVALSLCAGAGPGCGSGRVTDASPPPPPEAPPAIDAPTDAAVTGCVPRAGTTVVARVLLTVPHLPVLVTAPRDDPRLFVAERNGWIEIIEDGARLPVPFLDLSFESGGPVRGSGERGLLGLAFHPDYATNRLFYVFYTTDTTEVLAEYTASAADPNVADLASGRVLLAIPDLRPNHNGGMIEFGPDGYLYIGTGDGGGTGDPDENAQNPDSLLGKMLRIDVDHPDGTRPYGIPAGNPYAAGGGAPEILMWGLRNPWRWSFDRVTSDLYIGDVGQGRVEEIDILPFAELAGTDLGWDDCEGSIDYEGDHDCATPVGNRRLPVHEEIRGALGTSLFEAIIGGVVYRGACYPDLVGRYFYSDHNAGGLYSLVWSGGQVTDNVAHPGTFPGRPTAIYMDASGEMYIMGRAGEIAHIEVE